MRELRLRPPLGFTTWLYRVTMNAASPRVRVGHRRAGSLDRIQRACGPGGPVAGLSQLDTVGTGTDDGRPTTGRRVAVVEALDGCTPLRQLALD